MTGTQQSLIPDPDWRDCLATLQARTTPRDFTTYIKPLKVQWIDRQLFVQAPNRAVLQKVKRDFEGIIKDVLGEGIEVILTQDSLESVAAGLLNSESDLNLKQSGAPGAAPNAGGQNQAVPAVPGTAADGLTPYPLGRLDLRYTFGQFVEGHSNVQAKAACQRVASALGKAYNPLLIYGASGLGKTHLMQAVGNHVLAANPQARVAYASIEQWFNQMVAAIRYNRQDNFKEFYRTVDVLLIDDIQFIANKERTQEEFFHTFNVLIESGKQVVLTCDRYPRELEHIDERLKTRFTSGLPVSIDPPDVETQVAILMNKAETLRLPLAPDVAYFIAQGIRQNVRELEGALNRLLASHTLTGAPVTIDFVRQHLRDALAAPTQGAPTLEGIKKAVAAFYDIRLDDLVSTRRDRALARPRQVAMSLAKDLTDASFPEIGRAFAKDHTTVLHATRKVRELCQEDPEFKTEYDNLSRLLAGG